MREIKFRAWDSVQGIMLPVERINFREGTVSLNEGDNSVTDTSEMFQLMQYTGLKDRDDKEIYEGDLLELECDCDPGDYAVCKHEPWVGKVVWHQETASFELKGSGEFGFVEFKDDYQDLYRVIGNIHDNHELLAPKEGADKS